MFREFAEWLCQWVDTWRVARGAWRVARGAWRAERGEGREERGWQAEGVVLFLIHAVTRGSADALRVCA
jgi:hypothetical protein